MKPSHRIIFFSMFFATMTSSGVALITSGIALNQSNKALNTATATTLYSKNDEIAMAWLAGKTALAATRLGSKIVIPTFISKMWQ